MTAAIRSRWEFLADRSADLFVYGDKIMQALLDQEECTPGFTDSAVAVDMGRHVIEIEANAVGSDISDALAAVRACVRAALHAIGVGTPDWPTHDEALSMMLKDLRSEPLLAAD